jgi:transposase-like protein
MARPEDQPTAIESVLELLSEHGLGAMAEAMQTLLNEAMKLEQIEFLRAAPGERNEQCGATRTASRTRPCAPASVNSRCGFHRPGGEPLGFYPKALKRRLRSERTLKLAIAEMCVEGVSTRRVTEVTREFFAAARRALRPGGRFLQWVQLHSLDEATFGSIVGALRAEFPVLYGCHFSRA